MDPIEIQTRLVKAYNIAIVGESEVDLKTGRSKKENKNTVATVAGVQMHLCGVIQSLYEMLSAEKIDSVDLSAKDFLYRITVPDPAKVTTLGEMLFVMSLTSKDSRERILHDFAEQLYFDSKVINISSGKNVSTDLFKFAVATISQFGNQAKTEPELLRASSYSPYPLFPRSVFSANPFSGTAADSSWTESAMIHSVNPTVKDEVSSNQLEILYGLRAKVRRNVASELRRCAFYLDTNPMRGLEEQEEISDGDLKVIQFAEGLLDLKSRRARESYTYQYLNHIAMRLDDSETLSTATPRVAAADMMIKRFMETFETDFDKFFIDPMLNKIRQATVNHHIEFGSYEKKMILASNRLLSRVESTGTANVQVGDQENILAESATLLSILNSIQNPSSLKQPQTKSTNTTVANSLIDGAVASTVARQYNGDSKALLNYGIAGTILSALMDLPEESRGEVYSIGTGGSFKVTPIFNPSGQGLTFNLNYAQANLIQEPNGTTQLQAPRIERKSVNAEVQISNFDIGEIAGIESNYKLGRGEKRSGGVPILRDLFPSVPIVGWFARSPKVAPVRQYSLIFAQTAMYPTVGDIMDLLVENPTGGRFRNSGASDFSDPRNTPPQGSGGK